MIKTLAWTPFAATGMTVEQTRQMLLWAMAQWGIVCGLQVVSAKSSKADIAVRGVATDKWAGSASGKNISISTLRNMTGRDGFVLGGVMMHEIGHTLGLKHTPQTDAYRWDLMHPWGPADDWPSTREVVAFQKQWKQPAADFRIHEITYWGNKLRGNREKIEFHQEKKLELLEALAKASKAGNSKKVESLTAQIKANDIPLNHFRSTQKGWKSIYVQALVRWSGKKVPRAIVPKIEIAERKLAKLDLGYYPTSIGPTCCGFGQDDVQFQNSKLEPV